MVQKGRKGGRRFAVEFGGRVLARRQELGWTQEQLAREAELHWSYVSSVERGERNLTLMSILVIARALKMDAGDLVSGLPLDG